MILGQSFHKAVLLSVMPVIFSCSIMDWAFFQQNGSDQFASISIRCSRRRVRVYPFTTTELLAVPLCRLVLVWKIHQKVYYMGPAS